MMLSKHALRAGIDIARMAGASVAIRAGVAAAATGVLTWVGGVALTWGIGSYAQAAGDLVTAAQGNGYMKKDCSCPQ
jgi:hypothetical protein